MVWMKLFTKLIKMKKTVYTTLFLLLFTTSMLHPALIRESFVANAEDEGYIVAVLTGEGSRTDRFFIISDPQFRIEYSYITDNPSTADFQILVFQKTPLELRDSIQEFGESKNGFKDILVGDDTFFIVVVTNDIESWQVTISQQSVPVQTPIVDYEPLVNFRGTTDTTTEPFHISTDHFIVDWNYTTDQLMAGFFVLLYEAGVIENYLQYFGDYGSGRSDFEYVYPGQYTDFYFLVVTDENVTNWDLVVETPLPLFSNITCAANPTIIPKGDRVIINGSVDPAIAGSTITLTFTDPFNDTFTQTTETGPNGTYSFHIYPTQVGNYSVVASWDGGPFCKGSTSEPALFNVTLKIPTRISCSPYRTIIYMSILDFVNIGGFIDPPLSGRNVTVYIIDPQNKSTVLTSVTGEDGSYSTMVLASSPGTYEIHASWPGDETHFGAVSYLSEFKLVMGHSTITCNVSSSTVNYVTNYYIHGKLNANMMYSYENITLTFTEWDGSLKKITVTTDMFGHYNFTYYSHFPEEVWVYANWPGNHYISGSVSAPTNFTIPKIPSFITCFITPTTVLRNSSIIIYGNLDPEVSRNITLFVEKSSHIWDPIVITTEEDGSYSYSISMNKEIPMGRYHVYAFWDGDTVSESARSETVEYNVTDVPPTVSILKTIYKDETLDTNLVRISGKITPVYDGYIEVTITDPNGDSKTSTLQLDDGEYSMSYDQALEGEHHVTAKFIGDANLESTSEEIKFDLIAETLVRPGIPGFPIESILLSMVAVSGIIWMMRKRN